MGKLWVFWMIWFRVRSLPGVASEMRTCWFKREVPRTNTNYVLIAATGDDGDDHAQAVIQMMQEEEDEEEHHRYVKSSDHAINH